jgi:hypothetical protein
VLGAARATRSRRTCERGFTLIELLVGMLAGMVVLSALFTIVDVTMHQTTRTFSRVDATQRSRTAIEGLENQLHSACVGSNTTPIQAGSTDKNLIFVSQYGPAASPTPVWHEITYTPPSGSAVFGTLTDNGYSVTGSAPTWARGAMLAGYPRTVLTNVKQQVKSDGVTQVPVFQYFAYEPAYTDANGNTDMIVLDGINQAPGPTSYPNPDPLTVPLSASDAAGTVEVLLNLVVGPAGGSNERTTQSNTSAGDAVERRRTDSR